MILCNEYFCITNIIKFIAFLISFCAKTIRSIKSNISTIRTISHSQRDYLQLLRDEAEFAAGILLDFKIHLAQYRALNSSTYQKVITFAEENLVFC